MTKKQIIKKTREYQSLLGLDNWNIKVEFKKNKNKNVNGTCYPDSRYLQALIEYNENSLRNIEDQTIIHELVHCITAEIVGYAEANSGGDEWLDYFNERITSEITHIILRLNG